MSASATLERYRKSERRPRFFVTKRFEADSDL
jgi:hypothetical protein